MPGPLVIPAIAAAAQLGGAAINAFSTAKMNKKTRKWNEKMYDKQRADSLSDWALQNEYNSPRQQMQRLQEANLNPHLIYGGGSGVTEAGQVKSTDVKSWNPETPAFGDMAQGVATGALSFYDMQIKKAQADNLTASNTNIKLEAAQKLIALESGKLTLKQKTELDQISRELFGRNPMLQSFIKDNDLKIGKELLMLNQYDEISQRIRHNEEKHPGNLRIQLETINQQLLTQAKTEAERQHVNAAIQNLLKEGNLKALDIQLKEQGVQPGDPAWMRVIIQQLNKL